jgi:hypothetical protein
LGPTSILSYAQNAEDLVLSCAFADPEFGFYADIGVRPSRAIRNCERRGTAARRFAPLTLSRVSNLRLSSSPRPYEDQVICLLNTL